jgi:hypothetical protein
MNSRYRERWLGGSSDDAGWRTTHPGAMRKLLLSPVVPLAGFILDRLARLSHFDDEVPFSFDFDDDCACADPAHARGVRFLTPVACTRC